MTNNTRLVPILAIGFLLFICLEVVKTAQISKVATHRHDNYALTSNYQHLHDRPNSRLIIEKSIAQEESQGKYKGSLNPLQKDEIKKDEEEKKDDHQEVDKRKEENNVTTRRKRRSTTTMDNTETTFKKEAQDPEEELDEDEVQEDEMLGERWSDHHHHHRPPMDEEAEEELYDNEDGREKRKGRTVDGFLGMRGKKESSTRGFLGMRGKKGTGGGGAFYGMRGKKDAFYGMRGRRQEEDTSSLQNRVDTRNLKNGFLGMRGKKLMEFKRRIQGAFVGMRGKKSNTDKEGSSSSSPLTTTTTRTTTDQGSVSSPAIDSRHVRDVNTFLRQWANQLRRRRMSYDDRLRQVDNIFIGMRG